MAKNKVQSHPLTTENLHLINQGVIASTLDAHIRRALSDLEDRPMDKKARKVTLEIVMVPNADATGNSCEDADIQFKVKCSLPPAQTREYRMPTQTKEVRGVAVTTASFTPHQEPEPEREHANAGDDSDSE